ncbi:hypothetical protein SDC49_25330 [Lactobacillus sp. R2/2]|nr:hypothetical protein [Lactobacillus sp. R2/2]
MAIPNAVIYRIKGTNNWLNCLDVKVKKSFRIIFITLSIILILDFIKIQTSIMPMAPRKILMDKELGNKAVI